MSPKRLNLKKLMDEKYADTTNPMTNAILDVIAEYHTKTHSDYALAELLGISRSRVSSYRKRGVTPDTEVATKIALIMDWPVMYLLSIFNLERRSLTQQSAEFWKKIHETTRGAVTSLLGAVALAPLVIDTAGRCILCQIPQRGPSRLLTA